jgi:hypothetical protein
VTCGTGWDYVVADPTDRTDHSCEFVIRLQRRSAS